MATPSLDSLQLGVLGSPSAIGQPIQNPLMDPQTTATLAAMAQARAKKSALEQQLLRAAALREEPLNAKGPGPMGARQGVGPMGWAVTLGDAVAGAIAKNRREKAAQNVTGAMGQLSPAEQEYVNRFIQGAPGGVYGGTAQNSVAQGSPLSLPLSY